MLNAGLLLAESLFKAISSGFIRLPWVTVAIPHHHHCFFLIQLPARNTCPQHLRIPVCRSAGCASQAGNPQEAAEKPQQHFSFRCNGAQG